ncbi:prepilin peptidase [Streptococcus dysgalactiae]|uniref:Leader peptidase (Prepilin peptidase) / N-methyltransferase n=1 Tax=Streptococcus dysgalactiae subsp. equisimilis TaxID=119602 RepID=A0A9X8T028_STREQ|nr:prepilin peptidase [Streptococcus dysgalactiae]SQF67385.1 leader peptidase (prepilin peptidase) / N-methyltransferase [Streptococcus dysgalactiae subsp. equisimilis]VEF06131.1 leader peptidase (prepilin peptidase) / N-methyltransferase [Streptococcus dysgalactiae subsp. equisimilis]
MNIFFSFCLALFLSLLFRYLLHFFTNASQEEIANTANESIPLKEKLQHCQLSLIKHVLVSYHTYFTLEISLFTIFMATLVGWMDVKHCYLLLFSLLLSLFDWQSQEYPFLLWLVTFVSLLPFYSINHTSLLLLLLGLLAYLRPFSIGAGDFLYLASLALVFDLMSLIWLVQLASLAGIAACLLLRTKHIPFIPYLTFGLLCIIFLEKYLIY